MIAWLKLTAAIFACQLVADLAGRGRRRRHVDEDLVDDAPAPHLWRAGEGRDVHRADCPCWTRAAG